MDKVKGYFKEEGQLHMLGLQHPKPAEFYLSPWQSNRSPVLLLILRCALFLTTLGIILSSMILYGISGIFGYWFIYLTHWGLLVILFATGLSIAVSARSYLVGPKSIEFMLPWYVKTYWVLYNIANPIAYLITIFYWTVLYSAGVSEELNYGLDIAVHGLNTIVMLLLLISARLPSRLLHFYQPLVFGATYAAFGLLYYFAGGKDPIGNPYVYPVIDWTYPGTTVGVLAVTGLLLICLHLLTVGLALARDALTDKCFRPSVTVHVEEAVALRQQGDR